jgi:hypothetical protein
MCELDSTGSEQGQVEGSCEYGNKPMCAIEYGEFFSSLNDYQLLRKTNVWS